MPERDTSVIAHDLRDTSAPDRNLALELVRVTEAAALAAARWVGRGEKEDADQAAIQAALPRAEAALDLLERFVAGNGTILGRLTIAEFAAGPVVWRTKRLPLDLTRWPKVLRLRDAIEAHPAFQAAEPVG